MTSRHDEDEDDRKAAEAASAEGGAAPIEEVKAELGLDKPPSSATPTYKHQEQFRFARAVQAWPVRSPAVRHHLALHDICPDCGADAPCGMHPVPKA